MKDSPLEQLLQGRSQEFQETVRALVQQYDIDETDPTFILLVGTTTLEALLTKYPQQFESLFISLLAQMSQEITSVTSTASKKLAEDWHQLQVKLSSSALDTTKTAHQIDNRLHEVRELLNDKIRNIEDVLKEERSDFKKFVADEQETIRVQAGAQAELITTLYEEQVEELKAQAGKLAAHATATAQANLEKQLKEFNKGVKWKYYVESIGIACICAAALMVTSWTTAWISRGRAEDNTYWADIERWNGDELQACVDAGLNTCNFHIDNPENSTTQN